jgi:hypothetical protein
MTHGDTDAAKDKIAIQKVDHKHLTFAERMKEFTEPYVFEDIETLPAGEEVFW